MNQSSKANFFRTHSNIEQLFTIHEFALPTDGNHGTGIENAASQLTNIINKEIVSKNTQLLIVLEHLAISRENIAYGQTDQRMGAKGGLIILTNHLKKVSKISEATQYFIGINNGVNFPDKIPNSDPIFNIIRKRKSQLTLQIRHTASPALKNYYAARKSALDFIKSVYIDRFKAAKNSF